MITSLTPDQANFIAGILSILQNIKGSADGFSISVNLHDELFDGPVGKFTQDEGAWLFEFVELPKPKPATLEEVALSVYNDAPSFYRERKIQFIKDLRGRWNDVTSEVLGLVDSKKAVEKVLADVVLAELREKLIAEPEAPSYTDYEDRAYAEHRERIAERGSWFGAPGPMDEEPF